MLQQMNDSIYLIFVRRNSSGKVGVGDPITQRWTCRQVADL